MAKLGFVAEIIWCMKMSLQSIAIKALECCRYCIINHCMCFCIQIRVARLEQLEKELHEAQSSRGLQEKSALPETQVTHTPVLHLSLNHKIP